VKERTAQEHDALMREFHQRALQYFKECADAFPFLQISCADDLCSCAYCAAQKGIMIPTARVTIALIPPFARCTSAEGKCRCTFIAIAKQDAVQLGLRAEKCWNDPLFLYLHLCTHRGQGIMHDLAACGFPKHLHKG
jgi:hypothetical protein